MPDFFDAGNVGHLAISAVGCEGAASSLVGCRPVAAIHDDVLCLVVAPGNLYHATDEATCVSI